MKLILVMAGVAVMASGCGGDDSDYSNADSSTGRAPLQQHAQVTGRPAQAEGLVMHPFHDPQSNAVTVQMPFPKSWRVQRNRGAGGPSITGPKGLQVFDYPAQSFMYTNDPQMQQVYSQSGQQLRAMPGIDGLFQQDIIPWANSNGLKLVKRYQVPEVARINEWYNSQLYKVAPTQSQFAVIGSEWRDASGGNYFLLTHVVVSQGAGLQTWYHHSTALQAESDYFESARKYLINGLANARYNPQPIQAYNQREAQKAGQSWAAHNQRMRSNQAAFDASQRAIVESNNAVSDSIMQGWRDRNAVEDRLQHEYTNSIREENTMVNPADGQAYQVDSGANQYWMNSDGEYIPTDNYNYNPNIDPGVNNQNWELMQEYE